MFWCSLLFCPLKSSNMKTAIYTNLSNLSASFRFDKLYFCTMKQSLTFLTSSRYLSISYLHVSILIRKICGQVPNTFDHPFMPINSTKKHPRTRKECEECSFVVPKLTHRDEPIYATDLTSPIPAPFWTMSKVLLQCKNNSIPTSKESEKKIPYSMQTSGIPPSWFSRAVRHSATTKPHIQTALSSNHQSSSPSDSLPS